MMIISGGQATVDRLGEMGFAVIENESGKPVAAQIRRDQLVACLADIIMDEKDGVEILDRAEPPRRPSPLRMRAPDPSGSERTFPTPTTTAASMRKRLTATRRERLSRCR